MTFITEYILELINNIPTVMLYMAQGYVFISVYNFMLCKTSELNHLFFKSVVVSYVLKVIFDSILTIMPNCEVNGTGYVPLLFIFSAFCGYVCALLFKSEKVNDFLLKIGIDRTVNESIWRDVIKKYTWVLYYCKSTKLAYYGQYKYGEEFGSEPIIALIRYQVMDLDGNIIEDNSNDYNQVVLLNTKDFERIELVYEDNSLSSQQSFDGNEQERISENTTSN